MSETIPGATDAASPKAASAPRNVEFAVRDHVARVTIDRPGSMNAVDRSTELELEEIWTAIVKSFQLTPIPRR